jgi:hypothetical protein
MECLRCPLKGGVICGSVAVLSCSIRVLKPGQGQRTFSKVLPAFADKLYMDKNLDPASEANDPHFLQARALSISVGAIRKAQGKSSPNDFPVGSLEWHIAIEEFANDVLCALIDGPEDLGLEVRDAQLKK